ncbi:MAG: ester cyclase [Acidimicrobiia bacterium]
MTSDPKALVRRLYQEFWNEGQEGVVDEIVAANFVDHHVPPDVPPGPDGVKQFAANTKRGFPDFLIQIHQLVAEGDKVACHIEFSGTHTGEFNGIPPTGRRTGAQAISMFRVESGRLAEAWEFADVPAFLEPLGIVLGPVQS